ncbi:hypothetical protein GCM10007897_29070 [Sphingobium jiangsuense]|nr:hypothetical protein GCM10007897_29070 [Sphingobium jiangsuense]
MPGRLGMDHALARPAGGGDGEEIGRWIGARSGTFLPGMGRGTARRVVEGHHPSSVTPCLSNLTSGGLFPSTMLRMVPSPKGEE